LVGRRAEESIDSGLDLHSFAGREMGVGEDHRFCLGQSPCSVFASASATRL
jgi:hypothetical protein